MCNTPGVTSARRVGLRSLLQALTRVYSGQTPLQDVLDTSVRLQMSREPRQLTKRA